MGLQVVDLIKEYNALGRNCIALMLDTKGPEVRSGDLSAPIDLVPGAGAFARGRVRVRSPVLRRVALTLHHEAEARHGFSVTARLKSREQKFV